VVVAEHLDKVLGAIDDGAHRAQGEGIVGVGKVAK
jgi:hypothetical protein